MNYSILVGLSVGRIIKEWLNDSTFYTKINYIIFIIIKCY
jgi:hypothetical protein